MAFSTSSQQRGRQAGSRQLRERVPPANECLLGWAGLAWPGLGRIEEHSETHPPLLEGRGVESEERNRVEEERERARARE